MENYLVKLVYQIICGDGAHTAQFDEQLRFVEAGDEAEAFKKGLAIGVQEEDVFYNNNRQLVRWRFVNVAELYQLSRLADGAEVFSQIRETDDADSYSRFVHHKATRLNAQFSPRSLQTA